MRGLQRSLFLASCLGATALASLPGAASAWEWAYGPPSTAEDAYRRVHPVPACNPSFPGPGYIAIGTQDAAGPNPEVYVVYTDANGNSGFGWEATYDVEGMGLVDDGMAIVSIPNKGYVFLSNSLRGGVWRPALTHIDCKGNVLWSRIYPDAATGQHLWGNDLIRTQSGDPAFGTAAGDFAVAGWWRNTAGEDAFLMRTDPNGVLIVNSTYNNQNLNEAFNGLTEALPVAPALAGDLVAVGRFDPGGNPQGLVARVNGNTLAIGAAPQCIQHHGQAGTAEVYNSVTRIANFFPGQFAFVGTSTAPAAYLDDIWVTRGNTCGLTAQARIGNPVAPAPTSERGNDIIEVLVAKPGAPVGSLAIAGDHAQPGAGYDAALVILNPGLNPIVGQSRLFGDFGPNAETFFSLAEDPAGWALGPGYILAGLTQTPWFGPDPQDMYLVRDNPGVINCEKTWDPTRVSISWPQVSLQPVRREVARHLLVPTPVKFQLTGKQICP